MKQTARAFGHTVTLFFLILVQCDLSAIPQAYPIDRCDFSVTAASGTVFARLRTKKISMKCDFNLYSLPGGQSKTGCRGGDVVWDFQRLLAKGVMIKNKVVC